MDYVNGRKIAPSLIIVFTDGYFPYPDPKYGSKFGKDTIWVLISEASVPIEQFKPSFGKVAKFENR